MTISTAMAKTPIKCLLAATLVVSAQIAAARTQNPQLPSAKPPPMTPGQRQEGQQQQNIKYHHKPTIPANAGTALPPIPKAPTNLPGTPLDKIVAVAGDQPILQSDLEGELSQIRNQLQSQGTPLPPPKELRHQVLEHLITQSLELSAANRKGIEVSDDDVNRTLSTIASRNGLTLAQLPKALAAQGISYKSFRQSIKTQLILHDLEKQAVAQNISITSSEVKAYLKHQTQNSNVRYHVAQILIPFPSNPTPAQARKTLQKAKRIEAKIKQGANFASTAVAQSAGPQALKGGDLGWMSGAELPTLFADVVPEMKVGSLSDPIAGTGGYHIVKLLDKKTTGKKSLTTQYKLKQIMLKPNPVRSLKQAKALAETLQKKINSGKLSFDDAAAEYSDDPNSAGNGGQLGWESIDEMPPSFAKVIPTLKIGKASQPIKSSYGWHVVVVTATRKADANQNKRQEHAYDALFQRKLQEQMAEFKRSLRQQTFVEILDPKDRENNSSTR